MGRRGRSSRERLSRRLSYYLRHHPEELGLELDDEGFANVSVEEIASRLGVPPEDIYEVVARDPKGRFTIRDGKIRANFGHSVAQGKTVWESHPPAARDELPEYLYHGTSPGRVESILRSGLKARGRQLVHLSTSIDWAQQVGRRHSPSPAVLEVNVDAALRAGVKMWVASPSTVVATEIPSHCLRRVR